MRKSLPMTNSSIFVILQRMEGTKMNPMNPLTLLSQVVGSVRLGHDHYGFFGINGLFGILIGIIIFIVVAVILWKIMEIVLPKLGVDGGWMQVIKLLIILFLFLAFMHFVGFF